MKLEPLDEALKLALAAAQEDEVPVGAVVVHQGVVIGRGKNFRERLQSPVGHAEIEALSDAARSIGSWRLEGCELYVTLEPCPMCLSACQQARIRKVVYGARDEKGGAICLGYHVHQDARMNHRFEVIYEPNETCSKLLKEFFKNKRNQGKTK